MDSKAHWEQVYSIKPADAVSWYRPHLETSLDLIARACLRKDAAIVDVGGGEATLVDDLLAQGYQDVSVLDISQAAVEVAQQRLGKQAAQVSWLVGDITEVSLAARRYDVWHDRAVFHFLTSDAQRSAYLTQVMHALRPGGHVVLATFGPEGPSKCSGLEVVRYDSEGLHQLFGDHFQLLSSHTELHQTPFGSTQQFLYCFCRLI